MANIDDGGSLTEEAMMLVTQNMMRLNSRMTSLFSSLSTDGKKLAINGMVN